GACISIPGPTLKVLTDNINGTLSKTTLIFTGRSFGYIVGSIIGGVLFDCFNQLLLLALSMFCSAIPSFLIPSCTHLAPLAFLISLQGVSMGFLDAGGNVVCINVWGTKSASAIQSIHFTFGFGAFIAPLIAKPFLSSATTSTNSSLSSLTSPSLLSSTSTLSPSISMLKKSPPDLNISTHNNNKILFSKFEEFACWCSIKCPYWTISFYLTLVGIFIFSLYLYPYISSKSQSLQSTHHAEDDATVYKPVSMKIELTLLFMLSTFFFCYVGMEVSYGGLVASYSTRTLKFSQQNAALVTSLFWSTFSLGRLLSIFIANYIKPSVMIVGNLILTLIPLVLLTVSHYLLLQNATEILYAGSACLGLGMSSIFPAGVSWVGNYIKLTGKYASIFVVGSAIGEMVLPILGAHLMLVNDIYLIYMLLAISIFSLILFIIMAKIAQVISRLDGRRYVGVKLGEEVVSLTNLTNNDEDGDEENDEDSDLFDVVKDDKRLLIHQGNNGNKHVKFDLNMTTSGFSTNPHHNAKSILKAKDIMKND
ncbi:hypothetical protein HELRODRAFT_83935, partial [Helobdella robusta]|uniref:Major facilitator superfamily (MFS) profile domain-containing protein n=1 Tax=Helobdella robusta TaxID=6412 RepID=T1G5C0_HELRO